jgi:hypothetical protein
LTLSSAAFGAILFTMLWIVLPPEYILDKGGNVDWFGAILGLAALALFNFVWK